LLDGIVVDVRDVWNCIRQEGTRNNPRAAMAASVTRSAYVGTCRQLVWDARESDITTR
jgi:hypothetical protein